MRRLVKLADKYTGWLGEGCWRRNGRRFVKRIEHRYNRRHGKVLCLDKPSKGEME